MSSSQHISSEVCTSHAAAEVRDILSSVIDAKRIGRDECLTLFRGGGLVELGLAAEKVCRRLHPEFYRTFVIDRNINYTNICISKCTFCAFHRDKNDPEAYVLPKKILFQKIQETLDLDGTQILLQGGMHPDLEMDFYIDMLRSIKERFKIHIHAFSPPEIVFLAGKAKMSVDTTLRELQAAGLDTIPGGGAEILADRVRQQVSPHKCSADEWIDVMRKAHQMGMRTTATMMFGHAESLQDRVEHLERIRDLQDESQESASSCHDAGFTAFIPWTFQPGSDKSAFRIPHSTFAPAGGHEYLRTLAISRIFLDNVKNVQASWVTQGLKLAQIALSFGANDLGSTMIEENVVRAALIAGGRSGPPRSLTAADLCHAIKDAGFQPRQRDCYYRLLPLPN